MQFGLLVGRTPWSTAGPPAGLLNQESEFALCGTAIRGCRRLSGGISRAIQTEDADGPPKVPLCVFSASLRLLRKITVSCLNRFEIGQFLFENGHSERLPPA